MMPLTISNYGSTPYFTLVEIVINGQSHSIRRFFFVFAQTQRVPYSAALTPAVSKYGAFSASVRCFYPGTYSPIACPEVKNTRIAKVNGIVTIELQCTVYLPSHPFRVAQKGAMIVIAGTIVGIAIEPPPAHETFQFFSGERGPRVDNREEGRKDNRHRNKENVSGFHKIPPF
jgi:hypothetical protein